ncbi:MAG: putative membrane protein [Chloroflexi bacterium AL-W]|nr:putative membrane protein [Chloroflexi bacterium AL-N1]NOK66622.1 putative membrane protein [Chloroflexi bacterium AL-N10]NOK72010.1 putative membrane protein [Chloroflexi bacterium AL-N5]NOK81267.1 putative membrane protein [Chloroflexi bacterium AL-W]NOK89540.1 putative membrane protein [Chloroflexi bacterium AL-N15]
MRLTFQKCAIALFALYIAVFPGSLITVSLDRVPEWGVWMGSALLIVQGLIMLAWLVSRYGLRGLGASALIVLMAFGVEFVGEKTGFPFGRYAYTDVLQPQLFGSVPIAICFAWLFVVPISYEMAKSLPQNPLSRYPLLVAATLVLLLDLQIETVAAYVNGYWTWFDQGPYYNIPTANFVAWWLVGLSMAGVLALCIRGVAVHIVTGTMTREQRVWSFMPQTLYILNVVMFTAINLSHGYVLAGLIGVAILIGAGLLFIRHRPDVPRVLVPHQRLD